MKLYLFIFLNSLVVEEMHKRRGNDQKTKTLDMKRPEVNTEETQLTQPCIAAVQSAVQHSVQEGEQQLTEHTHTLTHNTSIIGMPETLECDTSKRQNNNESLPFVFHDALNQHV